MLLPVCPVCKNNVPLKEKDHVVRCNEEGEESLKVSCKICGAVFKRKAYYMKHLKNIHSKELEQKRDNTCEKSHPKTEDRSQKKD